MAMSEDIGDWQRQTTSKLIIKPVPAVQHPESFTSARAGLVATGVIFTLIGAFAIVCRILTIVQRRRKIGHDDHAMFVAYGCSIVFTVAVAVSVRWGVGLELRDVPVNWGVRAVQAIYTSEIFYYVTIFCVKLSLMFLYLRLAAELRGWFCYASVALTIVLVLHFMTTMTVVATQCIPIEKYWAPSTPGTCIDITSFFYSTGIFTIVTDVIMIALPIPIIWKIPRERRQKFAIMAAFLVAGGGTLASCVRLYSIKIFTQSPQPMRDAAPISTWSFIEINLGILCASSAVIKPIFSKTRAPSLETEDERRQRSAAGHRGTIGTPNRATILRDWKDCGRWSESQASTAVTSPNALYTKSDEREIEIGIKSCDSSSDRNSARLPDPPTFHQKTPKGRQSRLMAALPQHPDQPTSPLELSTNMTPPHIAHHRAKLSRAFPQYFASSSANGEGRSGGQPIAGW